MDKKLKEEIVATVMKAQMEAAEMYNERYVTGADTRWGYPLHAIQRMIAEGRMRRM